MGMDGVEILMEVEEKFGITIRNSEAQNIRKFGDLIDLVQSRLNESERTPCLTLPAFLQVRQSIRGFLQQPKLRLHPTTMIADVIPPHRRRAFWKGVLARGEGPVRSDLRLSSIATGVVASLICVAATLGIYVELHAPAFGLAMIGAVWVSLVILVAARPWRTTPPPEFCTIRDIVRARVGLTIATRPPALALGVTGQLQDIVARQLGIDPQLVVPDADFVKDLGMS